MREVAPGNVVLSFRDTRIAALGVVRSYCYESPKPTEFGTAGSNWSAIGWKIETQFKELHNRVRPKEFIQELKPHLPRKYSPLRENGDGLQSVYLTEVSAAFAEIVLMHVGAEAEEVIQLAPAIREADRISPAVEPMLEEWERREEARISEDGTLTETSRQAIAQARRGQGLFRQRVRAIERACRVTRVDRPVHLVASHIQPWRDSDNDARLDGENGLLLTPTVDHLFDKGFISFENDGTIIVSPVADRGSLLRMGIDAESPPRTGVFSSGQRHYLDYHRANVLRMMGR